MNKEIVVVVEKRWDSWGRPVFRAYFKHIGPDDPDIGHAVARRPHEAVSSLLADQAGAVALISGGVVSIKWVPPEEGQRWQQKFPQPC